MAQRGRHTKYTPETVEKLVQAIRLGAYARVACAYAGIDEGTFYRWLQEKSEFRDTIQKAEGAGSVGLLAKIEKAANDGNWQAAAWKLERRYPELYGRQTMNVKVDDWRSEAIADLRSGKITPDAALNVFGDDLARELFALAGVNRD